MKKIFTIMFVALTCFFSADFSFAQEADVNNSKTVQKEIKVTIDDENGKPNYSVETTTLENGEKKVTKKHYKSLEEMQADASVDVFDIRDEDGNVKIKIREKGKGVMVYTSEEGEEIKIKIDDNSEDMNWTQSEDDDGHTVIKSPGGKMVILNDEEEASSHSFTFMTHEGDSNHVIKKYEISVEKDLDGNDYEVHKQQEVFILTDEDGNITMNQDDQDHVMVWIDEEGNKTTKKTIHKKKDKTAFSTARIEPVTANDEDLSSFNLAGMPQLELPSIQYYPNPNGGEFTLTFTGPKRPTIVRILDLKGNMKMEENITDFNGTFNQVVNVKHFDQGTYLLQIFQRDKVLNRKLILE
jgi:hypothetical protein